MAEMMTLLTQVLLMFLLAGVGFVMFRTNKITREGSRSIANILIYLSLPCVIINSFLKERTAANVTGLLIAAILAVLVNILSILVSRFVFPEDPIASFASAFANPGFFGIPLIVALLGQEAVFYTAPFIALLNCLQWTYGVSLLTGKKGSISVKTILTAPFMVAIIVGLFCFFTGIRPFGILGSAITNIANLNTPLAMFVTGVYFAQVDVPAMLRRKTLYLVSLVRLVAVPVLTMLILMPLPSSLRDMKFTLLLMAACPVGSNVAVYAQLHKKNYPYAVETVVVSTLLSVITIPLLARIAGIFW